MDQPIAVGGLQLRCRVEGEGPDLVLVHGVGSRLEAWNGVVTDLGSGFRTIRMDLRGHGESGTSHTGATNWAILSATSLVCSMLWGSSGAILWDIRWAA